MPAEVIKRMGVSKMRRRPVADALGSSELERIENRSMARVFIEIPCLIIFYLEIVATRVIFM